MVYLKNRGMVMKVKELNLCLLDMSGAENCEVETSNLPSVEEFVKYIKTQLEEVKESGVAEIKEMNVALIDLSNAKKVNVK